MLIHVCSECLALQCHECDVRVVEGKDENKYSFSHVKTRISNVSDHILHERYSLK